VSIHRSSRKYHKWLMLFIGLQLVVWSFSGAYMVLMDIDYIHGDSLIAETKQHITPKQVNYSFRQLLIEHPQASQVELGFMVDETVYRFNLAKQKMVVSANDGQQLSPIDKELVIKIAKQNYVNKAAEIISAQLITEQPPAEVSARHLPVWRIDFDDFASPSFYISVNSAQLVTKRHSFWRIFDWMFVFHVMDYRDGEPTNKLLLIFSLLAFVGSVFGVVLTYFRLAPKHNKQAMQKNKRLQKHKSVGNYEKS